MEGMEPASRRPEPFRRLYDDHFSFVCALVRRMGVRDADVPDVAQETFATLARQVRKGLDVSVPARPYVRSVAFSRTVDWKRLARHREQPHGEVDGVEALADARVSEEPMGKGIRVQDCVDAVLERLPFEQQ